ncbi:MAG: hypothetical protein NTW20_03785 [Rhodobacterales bacterium]|nr:hypothetical protein [Rhodobacterales bacterium]
MIAVNGPPGTGKTTTFLLGALSARRRRYTIVIPWVIAGTMERVGLIAAFVAAIRHGAEIDVFADPLLNLGPAAGGLTQMEAVEKVFAGIGVRLHKRMRGMRLPSSTAGSTFRTRYAPSSRV